MVAVRVHLAHHLGLRVPLVAAGPEPEHPGGKLLGVPHLGEAAKELYVFQRTPNYTVPAHNAPLDPEEVKEINKAQLLRLQSLLDPLENKAKILTDDLQGNNAAANLLKYTLNLIEKTRQDIRDLEYIPDRIADTKNLDLTIGKNIQTIKDLLIKVEQLIYTSS